MSAPTLRKEYGTTCFCSWSFYLEGNMSLFIALWPKEAIGPPWPQGCGKGRCHSVPRSRPGNSHLTTVMTSTPDWPWTLEEGAASIANFLEWLLKVFLSALFPSELWRQGCSKLRPMAINVPCSLLLSGLGVKNVYILNRLEKLQRKIILYNK